MSEGGLADAAGSSQSEEPDIIWTQKRVGQRQLTLAANERRERQWR
jgi:hypothetical protein